MHIVLERTPDSRVAAVELDDALSPMARHEIDDLPAFVEEHESRSPRPRWVWDRARGWYPPLLAAGLRVERCVDLAACHRILRTSALTASSALARAQPDPWEAPATPAEASDHDGATLFDLEAPTDTAPFDAVAELRRQQEAVSGSEDPARIRLLLAAECAGVLVAEEMRFAGLPWRADVHEALLTEALGPRVPHGSRPERLEALAARLREALDAPSLNPDSQADLLSALKRAGIPAVSTRAWELRELDHPAIPPLLEYRRLSRLLTANGWAWLDSWVSDGRFHPEYVVGGVVTGRWASSGGGALQLPKSVRSAVVADPGWKLVVADAGQLEPRVLSGLAGDTAMAAAGHGRDFYDAIVADGIVATRHEAKVAMLGAMYGATTGDSARLRPQLLRAFPRALGYVDAAAAAGERGEPVVSRLGRTAPRPGASWAEVQAKASQPGATAADERRARSQARDWGRFTRNFVVQASAAEWALCWMAEIRLRLTALADAPLAEGPHLVFFVHDEVVVHTPVQFVPKVETVLREAALDAGRLLFGDFPVDFPLTVTSVDSYADAK